MLPLAGGRSGGSNERVVAMSYWQVIFASDTTMRVAARSFLSLSPSSLSTRAGVAVMGTIWMRRRIASSKSRNDGL